MKVAIYLRCSTKKQDLDSQRNSLIGWTTKNNYEYVMYEDFAISGQKDNRVGINQLLEDAQQKKFEIVGILEISRLGRSVGFIHKTIEELSKLGIKVYLTNNNVCLDYNTLEGRALIGGLALAADIEWLLIQERNARGRQAIKDKNIKLGRKHKVVGLEAIKALHEKGLSLRQIANQLGVSAPTIMRRFKYAQLCNVT